MSQPSRRVCDMVDQRDQWSCLICGRHLGSVPASRHHRQMRSQAPRASVHRVENIMLVCGTGTTGCHGRIHAHPAEAYKKGWLVHSWDLPEGVPVVTRDGLRMLTSDGRSIPWQDRREPHGVA